jgi:hypothetical protein
LDLYFSSPRARQTKTDPEVAAFSETMRSLDLGIARPDPQRFRNVTGVFMKLQNFKALHPAIAV